MEQNQIHDDIRYIKQMIENNRRVLVDNGLTYISVGIFVAIGSIISFFLIDSGNKEMVSTLWLVLMAILIVFNLYRGVREKKGSVKKTFASRMFNATWQACGIPMVIIAVIFMTTEMISAQVMFAFISSILGVGYFLTGVINDLKFMKWLALGWWISSMLSIYWTYIGEPYQLSLLFAILFTFFEIIPGIVIYKKWKRV